MFSLNMWQQMTSGLQRRGFATGMHGIFFLRRGRMSECRAASCGARLG